MALRTTFMGTSDFAVPALKALNGLANVLMVYTQPPRKANRGQKLQKTPVHVCADELGLPVSTPTELKSAEEVSRFQSLNADLTLVASYGLLLPESILQACPLGAVNIHASLLPRWRGASPIQQAILCGDEKTGVDFFQMEKGLDTGPVLFRRVLQLKGNETGGTLHDRLADMAGDMVPDLLDVISRPEPAAFQQSSDGITYAPKIGKKDAAIDWSRPATSIERQVRAFDPWPGTHASLDGKRVKIQRVRVMEESGGAQPPGSIIRAPMVVSCGEGSLLIERLQSEGRKPMEVEDWLRGQQLNSESSWS